MTERNKNILLGVLIVGVLSMTVAFAALSTRLNIGGQASVASTNWNVHFDNWEDVTENTTTNEFGTQQNTAEHPAVSALTMTDSTNVTKVDGLNITLKQPNDYARYTFEIVNEGSIDAELSGFSANMTCTSNNNCSAVVDYEVKCYETNTYTGTEVTTQSVLYKDGHRAYCYLQVKYKDQSSAKSVVNKVAAADKLAYTQEAISFSLAPEWTWVQRTVATNNIPGSNYGTTFNGAYRYDFEGAATSGNGGDSEWVSTLNPDVPTYQRYDGTKIETCGVFGSGQSGTVCLVPNADGYASNFANASDDGSYNSTNISASGLTGYSLDKATEMLDKGASSCRVIHNYIYHDATAVECEMQGDGSCYISSRGEVACPSNGFMWIINSDGTTNNH